MVRQALLSFRILLTLFKNRDLSVCVLVGISHTLSGQKCDLYYAVSLVYFGYGDIITIIQLCFKGLRAF